MKDPTRFLELRELEPDAATELLRAGATEEPPAGAMERLLGVLSAPAAASGSAVPAESHLSGVRPALRAAANASGVAAKLSVRWLVLAGGSVSLIAAAWLAGHPSAPASRAASHAAPVLQPSAAQPPVAQAVPLPPSEPLPVAQRAHLPPAATPVPVEQGGPKDRRTRSLAQEIASLDQVRQLLGGGQAGQALAALRRHARTYPNGALQQEASVLRIEALLRAGEPTQARALAARFLEEHADSPHQQRVRALVNQADGAP